VHGGAVNCSISFTNSNKITPTNKVRFGGVEFPEGIEFKEICKGWL